MEGIDLDLLKEAGLTEYEAQSYVGLLKYGTMEGSEVAEKTNVPKTRVYDALKSLTEKGLASRIQERPMKFSPTDPNKGLKPLYEKKKNRIDHVEQEALDSLEDLETIGKRSEVRESVDVVLGQEKMFSHIFDRIDDTKDEIIGLVLGRMPSKRHQIKLQKLSERDVNIRLIVTQYDSQMIEKYNSFSGTIKMRYYDSKPEYAILVKDTETAMLNVSNPDKEEDRISIFFEVEGLANAFSEHLENIWQKSTPVEQLTSQEDLKNLQKS